MTDDDPFAIEDPTQPDGGGTYLPTLCPSCTRRLVLEGDTATCTSFPGGIPEEIAVWGEDHRTSRAGEQPFQLDPENRESFDDWIAVNEGGST